MRSAKWFGIDKLYLYQSVDPFNPKTIRASVGQVFFMNFYHIENINIFFENSTEKYEMEEYMPTNLAIDDALLLAAKKIGKHKTKRAVVNEALQEYIQRRKQYEITELFGKVEYDENYDYKKQRKSK